MTIGLISYRLLRLPFEEFKKAYQGCVSAINMNSIKQSQTMFARRVFELLGCNTITLGNFSRGLRLMFAAQPTVHSLSDIEPLQRAAFVGSYSRHIYSHRRAWQNMAFTAADPVGVTVYDRNSNRRRETYRYPEYPWIEVKKNIACHPTGEVYNTHAVNLNVNTVTDSSTAFSRRLLEILSWGGLVLTNPTPAVARFFGDYCATAENGEEAHRLFARIARDGLSPRQREQARAAAEYVLRHHAWQNRLQQITEMAA